VTRWRVLMLVALLVAVGALGGCSSSAGPKAADLEGSWVVESFGAPTGLTPAAQGVTSELTMAAGKASGTGGVNSFSGTYEAKDGGDLKFGPIAATLMAGADPAADAQETAFFAALEKTDNFEINDGKLVLGDLGNNTLMVLVPK